MMKDDDPTRVSEQPALTTSSGRSWLVVGAILSVIAVTLLVSLLRFPPAGVAIAGVVLVAAGYAAMVVVRLRVPAGRRRLRALAALLAVIALVSLLCVGTIAATQWLDVARAVA